MYKLLKFSTKTCQPCLRYNPTIEAVVKDRDDVELEHVDIEENPTMAGEYGVSSVPFTVLLSPGGEALAGFKGVVSTKDLNSFIDTVKEKHASV